VINDKDNFTWVALTIGLCIIIIADDITIQNLRDENTALQSRVQTREWRSPTSTFPIFPTPEADKPKTNVKGIITPEQQKKTKNSY
jgi:hypothetical protein